MKRFSCLALMLILFSFSVVASVGAAPSDKSERRLDRGSGGPMQSLMFYEAAEEDAEDMMATIIVEDEDGKDRAIPGHEEKGEEKPDAAD
ncbi:hypothetical protein [Desulfolithobacter sp.]